MGTLDRLDWREGRNKDEDNVYWIIILCGMDGDLLVVVTSQSFHSSQCLQHSSTDTRKTIIVTILTSTILVDMYKNNSLPLKSPSYYTTIPLPIQNILCTTFITGFNSLIFTRL